MVLHKSTIEVYSPRTRRLAPISQTIGNSSTSEKNKHSKVLISEFDIANDIESLLKQVNGLIQNLEGKSHKLSVKKPQDDKILIGVTKRIERAFAIRNYPFAAKLLETFQHFDLKKNNEIPLSKLRAGLSLLGIYTTVEEVETLCNASVRGHSLKTVRYKEFINLLEENTKEKRNELKLKLTKENDEAAIKIQSLLRKNHAQRQYCKERNCAVAIQSITRGHMCRHHRNKMQESAVQAQAVVRGMVSRKVYKAKKKSARVLQKRFFPLIREKKRAIEYDATTILQRNVRRHQARERFKARKKTILIKKEKQINDAATKLQCFTRQIAARKKREVLNKNERQRNDAAIKLQLLSRRKAAYRRKELLIKNEKQRNDAAIKLQCFARQKAACRRTAALINESQRNDAATKMQCFARQKAAGGKLDDRRKHMEVGLTAAKTECENNMSDPEQINSETNTQHYNMIDIV